MSAGTVPVITHVITQQSIPPNPVIQNVTREVFSPATPIHISNAGNGFTAALLGKFLKGEPKALGTIQIMIGLFTSLSAFSVITFNTAFVGCGVAFWGSLIYISTGSLTVSAGNKLIPCMVKSTLGMNVASAITAGVSIFILGADIAQTSTCYFESYSNFHSYSYPYLNCMNVSSYALLIVLVIFILLDLGISISISVFACKAICSVRPMVMFVSSNPSPTAPPV